MQSQAPVVQHISNTNSNPSNTNGQNNNLTLTLPQGWKREECTRPLGLGSGKSDVYYISTSGQIVRNKQEMQVILGEKFDMALFDWRTGKFVSSSQKSKKSDDVSDNINTKIPRLDGLVNFPIRRTSPIDEIKPIVISSHPECKRTDNKIPNQEVPRQLFWEKRLAGNYVVDVESGETCKSITLPKGLQSAGIPGYNSTQLIQSLVNALYNNKSIPITGQEQQPSSIEKNPCATINHNQPYIKTFIVTDDDIKRQEARVKELRRKLEVARRKLHPRYETEREG